MKEKVGEIQRMCTSASQMTRDRVIEAETSLDRAELQFGGRTFGPFWDEIEYTAQSLAGYSELVKAITEDAASYRESRSTLEGKTGKHVERLLSEMPPFSLPAGGIPDARPTAKRMSALIREAQGDFEL